MQPASALIHNHLASWTELSYSSRALRVLGAIRIYIRLGLEPSGIYCTGREAPWIRIYSLPVIQVGREVQSLPFVRELQGVLILLWNQVFLFRDVQQILEDLCLLSVQVLLGLLPFLVLHDLPLFPAIQGSLVFRCFLVKWKL